MTNQVFFGNFSKGLSKYYDAFNIDNDAFPYLVNFYVWRGSAKRKRGSSYLGQLTRQVQSVLTATPPLAWQYGQLALVSGVGNLISGFTLEASSTIVPGTINVTVGANTYTDPAKKGVLVGAPAGSGTINYATGAITIVGGGVGPLIGTFSYYPELPVMGLRDFSANQPGTLYPLLLAFDTKYSYQINQLAVPFFYSTSYYKGTNNPVIWHGDDYQQFWTANYMGALWASNNVPGFHFKSLTNTLAGAQSVIQTAATTVTVGLTGHGLVTGDYVFINEVTGTIATGSGVTANQNINGQSGAVTFIDANSFTLTVAGANFQAGATGTGGIAQYLTKSVVGAGDGIRWYDGDPTGGTGLPTGSGLGWVNFAPPLTAFSVSLETETTGLYYLVGALAIVPFKDRILFFGPWIQLSGGQPRQLFDAVIWSWNGTPYYSAPVPVNQTFDTTAYYVDTAGKGGYLYAGIAQPITTITTNEDMLLVGFGGDGRKTRFAYTGTDLQPFLFYTINSELPSSATFSSITLDKGAIDLGPYGIAITDQQSSQRIDMEIPDEVFQIRALDNGVSRVNAIRDFLREWIYFSYPVFNSKYKFPTQSFLYNYRDNTWAVFYENYTTHGRYRATKKQNWGVISARFRTWASWREPWNSGAGAPQYANIIAGNPQGFVVILDEGTSESPSGTIYNILDDGNGNAQIKSINHCVNSSNPLTANGDFLYFTGVLNLLTSSTITYISKASQAVLTVVNTFVAGDYVTISGVVGMTELNSNSYFVYSATGTTITLEVDSTGFTTYISGGVVTSAFNGLIGKVIKIVDNDNFVVDIPVPTFNALPTPPQYLGGGLFTRLSQPFLKTKQYPFFWEQGRQTTLKTQKYLMNTTDNAQATINIYLSQDPDFAWNMGPVIPENAVNSGLVSTQLLYTCPENTVIGLTEPNINLQSPTAAYQAQIWHRMNTSLIGDSIQIGLTLSDDQMRNLTYATSEIVLQGIQLTIQPGPHVC